MTSFLIAIFRFGAILGVNGNAASEWSYSSKDISNTKIRSRFFFFACQKDTVAVHAPHGSRVSIVGAQPLAIDRVPHVCHLAEGNRRGNWISVKLTGVAVGDGGARPRAWTHRVFGYREEQVSFPVVLDLSDGPLMALQQDGFLGTKAGIVLEAPLLERKTEEKIHPCIHFLQIQMVGRSEWWSPSPYSRPCLLGWAQMIASSNLILELKAEDQVIMNVCSSCVISHKKVTTGAFWVWSNNRMFASCVKPSPLNWIASELKQSQLWGHQFSHCFSCNEFWAETSICRSLQVYFSVLATKNDELKKELTHQL